MRTLFLVLFCLAIPLAEGRLKPTQEVDLWHGSGVDLNLVKSLINDRDCTSAELYFESCRAAILEGADKAGKSSSFRWLKNQTYSTDFRFAPLLEELGKDVSEMQLGAMINAQLRTFDRYARLVPTALAHVQINGESKTYYGIGLETLETPSGLIVFAVYPNTPAAHAKLQPHDRILSLNGLPIYKSHRLGGEPNEILKLEFIRERQATRTVKIKVSPIVIPDKFVEHVKVDHQHYLKIRLHTFGQKACDFVREQIDAAKAKKQLDGVVLDLRQNAGGQVSQAECISRLFIGEKLVLTRVPLPLPFPVAFDFAPDPLPEPFEPTNVPGPYSELPVVVLIDSRSASAAEIVAAALQDHQRAWIIGERSFGKGVTQTSHDIPGYPRLKLVRTEAQYLRPSGEAVDGRGVSPDFRVAFQAKMEIKNNDSNWKSARPLVRAAIQNCLSEKKFRQVDRQSAFAFASLACAMKHNSSPRR